MDDEDSQPLSSLVASRCLPLTEHLLGAPVNALQEVTVSALPRLSFSHCLSDVCPFDHQLERVFLVGPVAGPAAPLPPSTRTVEQRLDDRTSSSTAAARPDPPALTSRPAASVPPSTISVPSPQEQSSQVPQASVMERSLGNGSALQLSVEKHELSNCHWGLQQPALRLA